MVNRTPASCPLWPNATHTLGSFHPLVDMHLLRPQLWEQERQRENLNIYNESCEMKRNSKQTLKYAKSQ